MEARGKALVFQAGSGQWSGDTCTIRGHANGSIGEPLGVENGLVEPSLEVHAAEGLYITRTMVSDRREVTVKDLYAIRHDQKLTKDSRLA
jgi:hypothetical protein